IARQNSADLEIFFYLKKHHASLEQRVDADMFALGCTPMINLFRQIAEPIQITHRQSEYRVVPDVRRTNSIKVHSIDRVTAMSRDGDEKTLHPFYSVKHAGGSEESASFWQAVRTSSVGGSDGTDFTIRLVDLGFDPRAPSGWTLNLETTCFNHDLPSRLPFGGGEPRLYLDDGGALEAITCRTAPTPMHVPRVKRGAYWRLVSHLNLNHLSLTDENGTDVLHEILRLYDFKATPESEAMINGFRLTGTRPVVRRLPVGEMSAICRGTEIEIEFDPGRYAGSSAYLLALVLERFLGLYCNINSFTQLVARLTGKEGIWRQWPPRAGDKALL
ncbi:MAG: type VI secretion system baseplate subunit TssF, partial [Hyphomicrobiaceae bacterium]